jgi:hypothetical protein
MSDWWSSKLAPQTQQRGGVVLPPVPVHQPQQPPHHGAPGTYQGQATPAQQYNPPTDDPNRKLSLREAISRFSGGESARVEANLACPQCGSRTGYTAFSGMSGMAAGVMGNRPASHCFECGYNGKFTQGDQANWA